MSDIPSYSPPPVISRWGFAGAWNPMRAAEDEKWLPLLCIGGYMLFAVQLLEVGVGHFIGRSLARGMYFLFYLPVIVLTIRRLPEVTSSVLQKMTVVLALVWALLSVVWSAEPANTLERLLYLVGSMIYAFYIGSLVPLRRMILYFGIGASIIAVLNILVIYGYPAIGVTTGGLWHGVPKGFTGHKNGLGASATMGLIFCITALAMTRDLQLRRILVAGVVLNLFTVYLSSSATALGVAVLTSGLGVVGLWNRRAVPLWVGLSFLLGFLIIIGVQLLYTSGIIDAAAAAMGRDADLSGRIPLWEKLWYFIEQRFWFGYGFEGFWIAGSDRTRLIESWMWFVPHYSHNGVVEMWLELGLFGVGIIVAVLFGYLRDLTFFSQFRPGDPVAVTLVIYMFFFLFYNFTEASFLSPYSMQWLAFVAFAVSLARTKAEAQAQGARVGRSRRL